MALIIPDVEPARRIPLVAPTEEAWRAMTPAQRDRLLVAVNEALSDPLDMMSEGRPHSLAKGRAIDVLSLHFRSIGRAVYLAGELAVLYPGQPTFCPDVIAVAGVHQPDDDRREAWVVAEEGRGIDLALEVLHHGDRKKDLKDNVERYARVRIPEYFVYDVHNQQIHGYRLPPGAGRYERIVPQSGRFHSEVLDLDLMVVGGKLQFFYGKAELIGSDDLIGRLDGMVGDLQVRANLAREEAEKTRAVLRDAILALLEARGLPPTPEARAWLEACDELPELQRRVLLATTAGSLEELLSE